MFAKKDYSAKYMRLILKTKQVPDNEATGALAKSHRLFAGKTQTATAAAMGVSKGFLCDLEHGRKGWTKDNVMAFKKAVRCAK